MKATIERLIYWINELPPRIHALSEVDLSLKLQPDKWSKKEVLGHLCDSALNNLQRFIRVQYEDQPYKVIKYAQNQWVELMGYQDLPVEHILNLWVSLNKQIVEIISKFPEDKLHYACDTGEEDQVTIEWIIQDYVVHMEHHLKTGIFT
jgi:hypothetical protein